MPPQLDLLCQQRDTGLAVVVAVVREAATVFGQLVRYRDEDFYKAHPTFTFDTLYEGGTWQVTARVEEAGLPLTVNLSVSPEGGVAFTGPTLQVPDAPGTGATPLGDPFARLSSRS